ncbi:MAG TPA: DUF2807 domain-containing protein [Bacteroidales bacterium]|nr:DUF2807 domain-containing protein [Bacteroidales bacterium]
MEEKRSNKIAPALAWILPALLLAILVYDGCTKSGGECLTNTGPIVTEDRGISGFDSIHVTDYVNLLITQDSVEKVVVEAGKNIIGGISTTLAGRELFIGNNNKCNWLRDYNKPINVHISVRNLLHIYYNASGNITSQDTLHSDSLKVEAWGGCGTIELTVRIPQGYFTLQQGTATIILHGFCTINSIYSKDYGLIRADDLKSGYTFAKNSGSNDCYVNASQYLEATIQSIGNIYYGGNPAALVTHINGTGQVIPL